MNRIIACFNVFNEAEHFEKALRSVLDFADEVIIVDGAYKDYPHERPWSTDGTLQIAARYWAENEGRIKIVYTADAYESQIEKRNIYLRMVKDGDYVMVVDGDWRVVLLPEGEEAIRSGRWDGFRPSIVKPNRRGSKPDAVRFQWGNPTCFRKLPGLHYDLNHYSLYDAAGRHLYFNYDIKDLYEDYIIIHLGEHRTVRKLADNYAYYARRRPVERASGYELSICADCGYRFTPAKGDTLMCPHCGGMLLAAILEGRHCE